LKSTVLVVCLSLAASPALAATRSKPILAAADKKAVETKAASKPEATTDEEEGEQKATLKLPDDPSGKLYEKFVPKRGFFISSDLGMMWVFNGAIKKVSNTAPYLGINIGYDIASWFSLYVHVGRGFGSNSARTANEGTIENWAFTNFLAGPMFWIMVWERLAIEIRAQGGIALMDPVPFDPTIDQVQFSPVQPVVGGGLSLKYLTLLTDFTLGLDVTFNYIIPVQIPALALSFSARYTF